MKPLPLYGTGENVRDWIYVEDNCQAIRRVLENGTKGGIYNIGSGNEKKNIDIAREILHHLSLSEKLVQFVGDRPGHDFRYSLHCEKIRDLGWRPKVTFEEGLTKTIDWYATNKWWCKPLNP